MADKKDIYRPSNPSTMMGKHCFSRFVNQFICPDDWGYRGYYYEDKDKTRLSEHTVPRHAKTKEQINHSLARKGTSHQIKRDNVWEGTLTREYLAFQFSTPDERRHYYTLNTDAAKVQLNNSIIRQINSRAKARAREGGSEYDYDLLSIAQIKSLIDTGKCRYRKTQSHCIETHIQAAFDKNKEFYLYCTSDPRSLWNMPSIDIDRYDDTTDVDINNARLFLSSQFPHCFYDSGSSGDTLHYSIIIGFFSDPASLYVDDINISLYRNCLFSLLAYSLSSHISHNFNVKFDDIKGSCPVYSQDAQIETCGVLVTLPICDTLDSFKKLYEAPVYSDTYVLDVINRLSDTNLTLDDIANMTLTKLTPEEVLTLKLPINITPPLPTRDIIGAHFNGASEKNDINNDTAGSYSKNNKTREEYIKELNKIGNSSVREYKYSRKYMGEYYKKYQKLPNEDKCREEYVRETGYSKFNNDNKRLRRFSGNFAKAVSTFDPEKISYEYNIGDNYKYISLTDDEITIWINQNPKYERKVYRYDLCLMMNYVRLCNLNLVNERRQKAISKLGIHGEENLKDTVSLQGYKKWVSEVAENYTPFSDNNKELKRVNKCNNRKASAILSLLEHLELVECLDDSWYDGIARKFRLTLPRVPHDKVPASPVAAITPEESRCPSQISFQTDDWLDDLLDDLTDNVL